LDDKQVSDLIGKAAIGHANSLFYNLTKSGAGIKFAKELESFAMRPFVSWRTKALDIPMVKKGMFYRMFGDDSYMVSDSLKLNLMMYAEQAQREARRVFWLQVAKSQEGNQDHNALRKFLPSWARKKGWHQTFSQQLRNCFQAAQLLSWFTLLLAGTI
jgi:hypothetical protein